MLRHRDFFVTAIEPLSLSSIQLNLSQSFFNMIVLLQKPEKKTPLTMKSLDKATKNMIHVSKAVETRG